MTGRAFRGSRYGERRILILGESNWGVGDMTDVEYIQHWLDHPNFTKNLGCATCIFCGIAANTREKNYPRDRLCDALTTMMLGWPKGGPTPAGRREAWSKVAFVNFIGRGIKTRAAADRPTDEDWDQAVSVFPALLAELNPRSCLVLDSPSKRLLSATDPLFATARVKAVRLPHPTMVPAPTLAARAEAWRAVA